MAAKKVTAAAAMLAVKNDKDVKREYDRLVGLFPSAPQQKMELYQGLFARAAFISVICGRLELDLALHGWVDEYQNGQNQSGKKRSVSADLHSVYSKLFLATMKEIRLSVDVDGDTDGKDDFDLF